MELEVAQALTSLQGAEALAAAAAERDPGSLGAAERLRRAFPPALAAAALSQEALRRRARPKLAEHAHDLLYTPDGLEQATRAIVAWWRARRLRDLGATTVYDLGCGLGIDALAFAEAGLDVVAVERDPATAHLATYNLAGHARVLCADATTVTIPPHAAVYADPARRDARGRVWTVEGMQPSWDFARELLGRRLACVKVGPGIPHQLLPPDVCAEWVSDRGDVVECSLWRGPAVGMAATRLPSRHRLIADGSPTPPVTGPRRFLLDPDGAVLRARCLPRLALDLDATLVGEGIAYLAVDRVPPSPWTVPFEVTAELPFRERDIRAHLREAGIGRLEVKKRGVDVDPAELRRRLKPSGPHEATLVVTPTPAGVRALVCRRVPRSTYSAPRS